MTADAEIGVQDLLTPEQVENARFPESPHGYEQAHVEAFLKNVAAQLRELQRTLEIARLRSSKPFEAAGKEMGDLLQKAYEIAESARSESRQEAITTLQAARKEVDRIKNQAQEKLLTARREADEIVSVARREVDAVKERLAKFRRHMEAEAEVIKQGAEREASRIIDSARRQAAEAGDAAARQAEEKKRILERRVRALAEKELALREKISLLAASLESSPESPPEKAEA